MERTDGITINLERNEALVNKIVKLLYESNLTYVQAENILYNAKVAMKNLPLGLPQTPNQMRASHGLEPIEGGDVVLVRKD